MTALATSSRLDSVTEVVAWTLSRQGEQRPGRPVKRPARDEADGSDG